MIGEKKCGNYRVLKGSPRYGAPFYQAMLGARSSAKMAIMIIDRIILSLGASGYMPLIEGDARYDFIRGTL